MAKLTNCQCKALLHKFTRAHVDDHRKAMFFAAPMLCAWLHNELSPKQMVAFKKVCGPHITPLLKELGITKDALMKCCEEFEKSGYLEAPRSIHTHQNEERTFQALGAVL